MYTEPRLRKKGPILVDFSLSWPVASTQSTFGAIFKIGEG
jgi:hypothetical protein